jgi:hypothetical protein
VGICHVTGSEKNPYVFIRVSPNAVEAHRHHEHDGRRDIIGVSSAAACPHPSPTAGRGHHDGHEDEGDRDTGNSDDGDNGQRGHEDGGQHGQHGQHGHADAAVSDDRRQRD